MWNKEMKMTPVYILLYSFIFRKAEGYADGDYTLHHTLNVSEFFAANNHSELLANCHEVKVDIY